MFGSLPSNLSGEKKEHTKKVELRRTVRVKAVQWIDNRYGYTL